MSYMDDALREYARNHGADQPDVAWILTPFDVWLPNPSYSGPRVRHPELFEGDETQAPAAQEKPPFDDCPF